jgi:DNA-binding transcriptional regulator LsrR (DeoR family)
MNKLHLLHKAEKLYCVENLSPEIIAEKLNISRRTVFNWKKKYKWDNHIVRIKDFSKQFADDIYNVGVKLLTKLNDDIDNNRILNKHEICALENIIKIIYKEEKERTKDLDNISHKKKFVKFLTPDIIEEINREILGWNGTY